MKVLSVYFPSAPDTAFIKRCIESQSTPAQSVSFFDQKRAGLKDSVVTLGASSIY